MPRTHISHATPPARERLRAPAALLRMAVPGILAGFLLFFPSGEGLAAPGAHMPDHRAAAPGHAPRHATADDRFAAMDKNGDGRVVLEEFRAANPGMSERAFVVIDSNGDGGIERAEWATFMQGHAAGMRPDGMGGMRGAPDHAPRMNNMPGDPMIPPPDSADLPLMRPPSGD